MPSIKKNLLYNFILTGSQLLLPLISIPYVSHVLDPEGIGKVSFIDSLTYFFISIAEFGIVVYAVREVARVRSDKLKLAKLTSELIFLHLVTSIITIFIYGITIFFLWQKVSDFRLILFSFTFLLTNALSCEWYYWGVENFRYITIRSILIRLAALASIFILVRQPSDYYLYYAIITASAVAVIISNWINLLIQLPVSFRNLQWQKHARKTWVTYFISLVYSIMLFLDTVLLRLVSTAAAVGYYAFAVKLVRLATTLVTDSLLVFYPHTVNLSHEQQEKGLKRKLSLSLNFVLTLSIPLGVGIFILAEPLTNVFFGPGFQPLAKDLQILAIFPIIKSAGLFLDRQLMMPNNQEKLILRSLAIGNFSFILLCILLSFYFDDIGASTALVIGESIVLALNIVYSGVLQMKSDFFKPKIVLQAILASMLFIPMEYAVSYIWGQGVLSISLTIVTCMILYFGLQLVMKNELVAFVYISIKSLFSRKAKV